MHDSDMNNFLGAVSFKEYSIPKEVLYQIPYLGVFQELMKTRLKS
jgi:hypothetical protein